MSRVKIADGLKKVENWTTGQSLIEQGISRLEELEHAFNSGYLAAYFDGPNREEIQLIPPPYSKRNARNITARIYFFFGQITPGVI